MFYDPFFILFANLKSSLLLNPYPEHWLTLPKIEYAMHLISNSYIALFLIVAVGLIIGRIKIKGLAI